MVSRFIQSANEVTNEWVSEILGANVIRVIIRENMAFNSSVAHLDVAYESNPLGLPEHVLVKVNKENDGQNEIQFY